MQMSDIACLVTAKKKKKKKKKNGHFIFFKVPKEKTNLSKPRKEKLAVNCF
jgi:hypothetical protein